VSDINTEELVGAFLSIRSARDKLLREYEAADSVLKKDQSELEIALLNICNEVNANSINTSYGTVMRKLTERFFCNDWENFYQFVRDNDAIELFEKRIHQNNFKTYIAERGEEGLPPGINVMREFGVSVRKASK